VSEPVILSIDPSSSCTGYAVTVSDRLLDAGRLTGNKKTDPALDRVLTMRHDLLAVLAEFNPTIILIEMPLEKQRTRNPSMKSGMSIWAGAAWALWMVCVDWTQWPDVFEELQPNVHPVSNTLWTSGSSKDERQLKVRARFKNYEPAADPGQDASDAIALSMWWRREQRQVNVKAAMNQARHK
jgi:Holliday junction resolvasome RuvABC endonuclease subunit